MREAEREVEVHHWLNSKEIWLPPAHRYYREQSRPLFGGNQINDNSMALIVSPSFAYTQFQNQEFGNRDKAVCKLREGEEAKKHTAGPNLSWMQSYILRDQDLDNYKF